MKRLIAIFPAVVVAASLVAPLRVWANGPEVRDPFRPFFLGAPIVLASSLSPLQRFALDDLHVEGIVSGIADPKALVRAPDGETYEVAVGGAMGNRGGRIAQITKDAVVVVEWTDEEKRELILGISPQGE